MHVLYRAGCDCDCDYRLWLLCILRLFITDTFLLGRLMPTRRILPALAMLSLSGRYSRLALLSCV